MLFDSKRFSTEEELVTGDEKNGDEGEKAERRERRGTLRGRKTTGLGRR